MKRMPSPSPTRAFTRLELLAVLAALALLTGVVLPGLAGTRPRSRQILCTENLRQLGQAMHQWMGEHTDRVPWLTEYRDGGNFNPPPELRVVKNNAWFQFAYLSNHLASPKLLACPSDDSARVASQWNGAGADGFFHAGFKNNAISYTLGAHATVDRLSQFLFADRNMKMENSATVACSAGFSGVSQIAFWSPGISGWNPTLHISTGNAVLMDGRVLQLTPDALNRHYGVAATSDNGSDHFLLPR